MPFVGDGVRAGDARPVGDGDSASFESLSSRGPSKRGGFNGSGDANLDVAGGEEGSEARVDSADMPGN
jgi:hypothetical protein